MPFFREGPRNIYFVHVPKCGGTTVERSLIASGIALSFLDPDFGLHDYVPWNRSSPQHLTLQDRDRLFGSGFFDYEFALVRDPVDRFLSAFNHQRRRIGVFVTFDRFLDKLERRNRAFGDFFGYQYDNHFVPAARFCADTTQTFQLEAGMDACLAALSRAIDRTVKPVPSENVKHYDFTHSEDPLRRRIKKAFAEDSPKRGDLDAATIERVKHLYAEDYQRFLQYA